MATETKTKPPAKPAGTTKKAAPAKPAAAKPAPVKKSPPAKKAAAASTSPAGPVFEALPFNQLLVAFDNVRTVIGDVGELAESIDSVGLLEPLAVERTARPDQFEVVAGSRRHAAIGLLRSAERWPADKAVPCMVHPPFEDAERVMVRLIENLQRVDLDPIEEARGLLRLTGEFGLTQKTLAARIGRSTSHISTRLKLLQLPPKLVAAVAAGTFPIERAVQLVALGDDKAIDKLTAGGQRVPSEREITDAIGDEKAATAVCHFTDRLDDLGFKIVVGSPPYYDVVKAGEYTKVAELDKISVVPEGGWVAYVKNDRWTDPRVKVTIVRPMTADEIEAEKRRQAEEREERRVQLQAAGDDRSGVETVPDDPARAAAAAEAEEHRKRVSVATLEWASRVEQTEVASWAMQWLVLTEWVRHELVVEGLGLDLNGGTAQGVVELWAAESHANLATLAAVLIAGMSAEDETEPPALAAASRDAFLRAAGLIADAAAAEELED